MTKYGSMSRFERRAPSAEDANPDSERNQRWQERPSFIDEDDYTPSGHVVAPLTVTIADQLKEVIDLSVSQADILGDKLEREDIAFPVSQAHVPGERPFEGLARTFERASFTGLF